MVDVRKATVADVPAIAESLARAFDDDPVMSYVVPARNHRDRVRRLFAADLRHVFLRLGETYTTATGALGAALWAPPKKWKTPPSVLIRMAPTSIFALGTRMRAGAAFMQLMESHHPTEPHYYLGTLGTDPAAQGKGVGGALLAPVLQRCDTDGVAAYLESSKETNVGFYRRHGFEVTGTVTVKNGPSLWLMWREPRSSTTH